MEVVDIILDLLKSLGVNSTIVYQAGIFLVTYLILSQLVFKPYLRAYLERVGRTSGSEDHAGRLLEETKSLEEEFQVKARSINEKFSQIFDRSKSDATKEQDRILGQARQDAGQILEKARLNINEQYQRVEKELQQTAQSLGKEIASCVVGKEFSK